MNEAGGSGGDSGDGTGRDGGDPVALSIDVTAERCPMTFVRTRLALDRLRDGDLLSIRLSGDEAEASVPLQATALGHAVVGSEREADGALRLVVRKRSPDPSASSGSRISRAGRPGP